MQSQLPSFGRVPRKRAWGVAAAASASFRHYFPVKSKRGRKELGIQVFLSAFSSVVVKNARFYARVVVRRGQRDSLSFFATGIYIHTYMYEILGTGCFCG